jgi:hypothetical protein
MNRANRLEKSGILVLRKPNRKKEIEFELQYLASLSLNQRFSLMLEKSKELKTNLINNGHRETSAIIKRK